MITNSKKNLLRFGGGVALLLVSMMAWPNHRLEIQAATNLVPNSSLEESADGFNPQGWTTNNWGSLHAQFDYQSAAKTGLKSAKVTVTDYTDGDAKWMFDPIPVQAGSEYNYSDWSQSDTQTYLWAQYTKTDGNVQYAFLSAVQASADWTQTQSTFVVPQEVTHVSLYHVLASNGSLAIDDISLTTTDLCHSSSETVPNGGFESTCPTTELSYAWHTIQYGTQSADFELSAAKIHSGIRSAHVINYQDGAEVGLETTLKAEVPHSRYALSFWHASTTYIYAYLAFTHTDGSITYKGLMSAPASVGQWSEYKDYFTSPTDTRSITVTIATSGAGDIYLDDVSLTPQPVLAPSDFNQALVSLTFDDGSKSVYTNALPVLQNYDYKATYYLNAGQLNQNSYMTSSDIRQLAMQGHEIGSHLYHHSDIAHIDTPTLESELQGNKASLQSIVGSAYGINSFASPYGSYTSGKIDTVMLNANSHRTTDGGLNTKDNLDPRQIHGRLVTAYTTIEDFMDWLAEAQATKSWLVLVYHEILPSSQGLSSDVVDYTVTPTNFSQQMSFLNQSGLTVKTVQDALIDLQAE